MKFYGITYVDGILADFGVSSYQFEKGSRGFSTRLKGPLDMRMNTESRLTAREVINEYSAEELYQIFKNYGELRNAKKLADHIVKERSKTPIETTHGLVNLLTPKLPKHILINLSHKYFKLSELKSMKELDVIKSFLEQSIELLSIGGRLACISYHSLEDRLVKVFIREGNFAGRAADLYGNRNLPFKRWGIYRFLLKKKLWITTGPEVVNLELQREYEKIIINIENGFFGQ